MTKTIALTEASLSQVAAQHAKLKSAKIQELEAEIAALKGNALPSKMIPTMGQILATTKKIRKSVKKTVKNEQSLRSMILELSADGQQKTIKELLAAVQVKGWKTSSSNPYMLVASECSKMSRVGQMNRVADGTYQIVQ